MFLGDLEKLFRMKNENYKIKKIEIRVGASKKPQETVTVTFERNGDVQKISSSEEEFCSYVVHLHSIPHIEDDGADFAYIDNPTAFFEIEKKIIDIFIGEQQELVICERRIDKEFQRFQKRIKDYERNWILSERNIRIYPSKLCQIFYDVGVLTIKDSVEKFEIISKERNQLSDLQTLLKNSQECDIAVCFSAFVLNPRLASQPSEEFDTIVGKITYDLKNKKTLSCNLNTLRQFQRRIANVGRNGLWECVFELFERSASRDFFESFLPLPLNIRDFTPLPWFCHVFLNGTKEDPLVDSFRLNLPLFIAFGTPLALLGKPSYFFNSKKQMAFVMLGFREDNDIFFHQVRFDVSKGKPQLHLDYVIYSRKGTPRKIIDHLPIDYEDIWDFSENLAIGFLAASAYDVAFDTTIVPNRISGIKKAFRKNPFAIYPLFIRSMTGKRIRWLKRNPKAIAVLRKVSAKEEIMNETTWLAQLENMGLVRQGRLTVLGDIVLARLKQTRNNQSDR